jgi:hypothetical protein
MGLRGRGKPGSSTSAVPRACGWGRLGISTSGFSSAERSPRTTRRSRPCGQGRYRRSRAIRPHVIGIFVSGSGPYGKVERVDDSSVLTTFRHVWWLPLVPKGSYILGVNATGPAMIPLGWHWRSILAAYLRSWGILWLVVCGIGAANGASEWVLPGVPIGLEAGALVALLAAGWLLLGRISPREAALRRTYGRFAGMPVDVSRFSRVQAGELREQLRLALATAGAGLMANYRDAPDPVGSWQELATHPAVTNRGYLEAALTRARLERPWVPWSERRALRRVHDAIWGKLQEGARP